MPRYICYFARLYDYSDYMKKLALLILVLLVSIIAAVYYFIPGTLTVTAFAKANCVSDAAFRRLSNEQSWNEWWPGIADSSQASAAGKSFIIGKNRFILSKKIVNNFQILIESGNDTIGSEMNLFSLPHDSTLIKWHFTLPAGDNFFKRIAAYRKAASLKKDMNAVLERLQPYLSDFKNVYGFDLHEASTKDTLLVTTKSFSTQYPETNFVYALITKLVNFCHAQQTTITGTPMLNITNTGNRYKVMVALPVNHLVAEKDSVSMIKMVPGKFIITEVSGGPQKINQAHQQIAFYFQDFRRVTMAVPFEYLVTDRQKETDTSKWLTRIYSPVY